jgi:hypothetical protein
MAMPTAARPRRARTLKALRCSLCPATASLDERAGWQALTIEGSAFACRICPACALEQAALRGEG